MQERITLSYHPTRRHGHTKSWYVYVSQKELIYLFLFYIPLYISCQPGQMTSSGSCLTRDIGCPVFALVFLTGMLLFRGRAVVVRCHELDGELRKGSASQIARFTGPTWGPPGSCRSQMGPMLAPWTLLSAFDHCTVEKMDFFWEYFLAYWDKIAALAMREPP